MIHSKMIHKKDTLKTGVVCCIHVMTVQERMAFVSFSHQFSKRLMMMKLCHSISGLKVKNSCCACCPFVGYYKEQKHLNSKNFKNLTNLIHHQDDHQLGAEWHVFATSYGTSPCDGISGTVKCLVTQSSFQNNHILNVDLIYDWCVDNIPGIIFNKIKTDDV